ncbi:MAG: NUDIX hydrolase [Acidimicrobiales bacterium]
MGRSAETRPTGPDTPGTVRAAGGILLRRVRRRPLEVAVVHRPNRDDWSLPKGKLDAGETFEQCALREVLEETGYRCRLGAFAGITHYTDRRGRPKVVAYWFMDPAPGTTYEDEPGLIADEVDEVRWLDLDAASRILTYTHDVHLVAKAEDHPGRRWLSVHHSA